MNDALQALLDKDAIADLIHAYCWHFDRNEPEELAALFTHDARIDYGPEFPPVTGRDGIESAVARGLEAVFAATSHHVSNIRITLLGEDEAASTCYLYAWHRYRANRPDGELWAQYHHRFRRTADGWRITELVLKAAGMKDFHRSAMHPIGRR